MLAWVILHHIIRTRYRTDHQGLADEDNNHGQVPDAVLPDLGQIQQWKKTAIAANREREYLMHYYNNAVEAVSWQKDVI